MRYLLDADIVSYAMRLDPKVLRHLKNHPSGAMTISAITEAELRFGTTRKGSHRLVAELDRFLAPFPILDFQSTDTPAYGELRAALTRTGQLIGSNDMLIAAQAIARKLVLVTNNEREFRRVPGLRVENWSA